MSARELSDDDLIGILEHEARNGPPSARIRAAHLLLEHHRRQKESETDGNEDPFGELDKEDELAKRRQRRKAG